MSREKNITKICSWKSDMDSQTFSSEYNTKAGWGEAVNYGPWTKSESILCIDQETISTRGEKTEKDKKQRKK